MKIAILAVLINCAAVVLCDDYSLLRELSALDVGQVIAGIFTTNLDALEFVTRSRVVGDGEGMPHSRDYDWDKCVVELGSIGDGLNRTEMWAMQVVDSWGKIPSGVLQGNVYQLGSFSECLNVRRSNEKYASQYCLATITTKLDSLLAPKPKPETRMLTPMPASNQLNFELALCFPQSCSPEAIERVINRTLPDKIKDKISVSVKEAACQIEESHANLRTIDWTTCGFLLVVLCLMIASTSYDIYCTLNELPKTRLFMIFSAYTNGRSLLSCKKSTSKDVMSCVHGIRVISTQWVVLGHTYVMHMAMPTVNVFKFMTDFVKQYHSMYMMSAMISVDTFFFLSGLFVSYTMLKHLEKTRGRLNVLVIYLHRFLRLTPLLAVAILITVSVIRYAGSGPRWPMIIGFLGNQCEQNWWKTLLYVQNYVTPESICFGHSWYLAVDMQLFLLSPLPVYLIYRFGTKSLYVLSVTVWLCVGCTIATYIHLDYSASSAGMGPEFAKTYYPTHLRFSPWAIGLLFGALLLESRKHHIRINRLVNLGAWAAALTLMATTIFANYPLSQADNHPTPLEYALYASLSRVAWSLALAYIIYACVHGYGGPVNWFLSLSFWLPLSRLSYSIYILHFPVILISMCSAQVPYYISEFSAYHSFLGNYVLTVAVAIIGSLAFESPIVIIEKMIFGDGRKVDRPNNAATA